MKYSLIGWFLGSAALSFFCTWLSIKIFPKLKLLDFPRRYNLKRERIPYPGGIFFVLASIGLVFIDAQFWFLVPVIFLLGLISFIDDRRQLPAKLRLVLYVLLITTVIVLGVQIDFIGNPLTGTNILIPAFLAIPITILWIIGLQQSMNWFDGLKGLSVGISGIGFLFMGILSVVRPELFWDPGHQSLMVALWALFWRLVVVLARKDLARRHWVASARIFTGSHVYFFRGKNRNHAYDFSFTIIGPCCRNWATRFR
jgi:UDP-N-acetylmuramyl pentapeptide phosphotransferase/UDP-N-acetylglucosamine-1-phosphate transferase